MGVLLRKLESGLRGISHVIVDEIRKKRSFLLSMTNDVLSIDERDINTDFLLVLLKDMLNAYPQLKVILMSGIHLHFFLKIKDEDDDKYFLATIDVTLFREYFSNCSMIEIEGKTHPVQEYFLEDIIQLIHFQGNQFSSNQRRSNNKQRQMMDDDEDELGYEDSQGDDNEVQLSLIFSLSLLLDEFSSPIEGYQLQSNL